MSKKETEFDRIERMQKLMKEASFVEKKKFIDEFDKKKGSRPKSKHMGSNRKINPTIYSDSDDYYDEEYEYLN